jgi:endonuclease III
MATHTFADKSRRLERVRQALKRRFGEQAKPTVTHPTEYAIRIILCEEATPEQAEKALDRLRKGFVDWNDLRVSRLREIRDVLGTDFPRASYKARVIPRLLDQVFKDHNSMVWDFLETMGKVEARAYFEKLEDVRPFVAATMARDCAEAHTFPVDNDISRTLGRVGVVQPGKETEAELQAFLERAVKSTRALEVHQLLKRLAQEFCGAEDRLCIRCVLKNMCPSVDLTRRPSKAAKAGKGKAVKVKGAGRTKEKPGRSGAARKAAAHPPAKKAAKRRKA